MSTWTEQIGYPVINVKVDRTGHVTLQQQHFLLNKTSTSPSSPYKFVIILFKYSVGCVTTQYCFYDSYIWSVPVTLYTDQGVSNITWLTKEKLGMYTLTWYVHMV